MSRGCSVCGGLIAEAGKVYGWGGNFCHCMTSPPPPKMNLPVDLYLRASVRDLIHLLQFAEIVTPSHGDAQQARNIMTAMTHYLDRT